MTDAEDFAHDVEFAEVTIVEQGELRPMFVVRGEGAVSLVPASWETPEDKEYYITVIRTLALAKASDKVSFMTEVWTRDSETSVQREAVLVTMIIRRNNKIEHKCSLKEILRDASGKVEKLGPEQNVDDSHWSGPLLDLLLADEKTALSLRDAAKMQIAKHGLFEPVGGLPGTLH